MSVAFRPDERKMFVGYSTHFFEWDLPAVRRELRAINLDWTDEPLAVDLPVPAVPHVIVREN